MNSESNSYWCLSRKDYNETYLESLKISESFKSETIDSFSTRFQYNGSHVKCDSAEGWSQLWYDTHGSGFDQTLPCVTSSPNVPVATFQWTRFVPGQM